MSGRRFPPEPQVFADRTTGTLLTALTTAATRDGKLYQTHPQWTADGIHVLFFSYGRSSDGQPQIFAVDEITGDIIQLTDGPGVYATDVGVNLAQKSNRLYYLRNVDGRTLLIELDLSWLLSSAPSDVVNNIDHQRVVAVLPPDYCDAGGFSLDADEKTANYGTCPRDSPPREVGQPELWAPGGRSGDRSLHQSHRYPVSCRTHAGRSVAEWRNSLLQLSGGRTLNLFTVNIAAARGP